MNLLGRLALVCALAAAAVGLRGGASADTKLRVYLVVLDGMSPTEIDPQLTPNLHALSTGAFHATPAAVVGDSRALMVAETIPNHVAMITGVHADRSGIPANKYWPRQGTETPDMNDPALVGADTLFTLVQRQCPDLEASAVLSKDYLEKIVRTRRADAAREDPDYVWKPSPLIPGSGHAPDAATMQEALRVVDARDPSFLFVNLGDVDRMGHVDETGGVANARLGRIAALRHTDLQFGRLLDRLYETGKWSSTVVIVTSDHSMDWSLPMGYVNVFAAFEADANLKGKFVVAQNGGVSLIYAKDRSDPVAVDGLLLHARQTALRVPGVHEVLYRAPIAGDPGASIPEAHADWKIDGTDRMGEMIVTVKAGYRTSDPAPYSNPIPGNHGHPVTQPNVAVVASPIADLVKPGRVYAPAGVTRPDNADWAPTVAALLGVTEPPARFDARALTEAVDPAKAASFERCS